MTTHPSRVVAEFHMETRHGTAHWTGVITREQAAGVQAIERGILDFGTCFGKPGQDFHKPISSTIKHSFRVASALRSDVMAAEHTLRVLNRTYVGNVDFMEAVSQALLQVKEEDDEALGLGGDSEPEDGDVIAGFAPRALAQRSFVSDALNEAPQHSPEWEGEDDDEEEEEEDESSSSPRSSSSSSPPNADQSNEGPLSSKRASPSARSPASKRVAMLHDSDSD